MIAALCICIGAVVLGSLLNCIKAPSKGKDIYVNGHRVELVALEHFAHTDVRIEDSWNRWNRVLVDMVLEGLLIRGLLDTTDRKPVRLGCDWQWREKTLELRRKAKAGTHV